MQASKTLKDNYRVIVAVLEGLENFVLCFLLELFEGMLINKVTLDRLICLAKICKFIFALCIDHNSPNLIKTKSRHT